MTCVSRRPEVWIVVHVPEQYNFSRMLLFGPFIRGSLLQVIWRGFSVPIADRSYGAPSRQPGSNGRDCHGELLQHPLMIRQSAGRICSLLIGQRGDDRAKEIRDRTLNWPTLLSSQKSRTI
jgi:hypothetical protein